MLTAFAISIAQALPLNIVEVTAITLERWDVLNTAILWLVGILLARRRHRSASAQVAFSIVMWVPLLFELLVFNGRVPGFETFEKGGIGTILLPVGVFVLFFAPSLLSLSKGNSSQN